MGSRSSMREHREIYEAIVRKYSLGQISKQIMSEMNVTDHKVRKYLELGEKLGYVTHHFRPPAAVELTYRLCSHPRLKHVEWFSTEARGRHAVAALAAMALLNELKHGDALLLDGGKCVAEFVKSIPFGTGLSFSIVPICADPASYSVSAYENMALLHRSCPNSRCERLPHHDSDFLLQQRSDVQKVASSARFAVLGVGPWQPTFTAHDFVNYLGLNPGNLTAARKVAAACGYFFLDAEGCEVVVPEVELHLPRSVRFADLQEMSRDRSRHCWLLAAGKDKAASVLTVVRAGLCDTVFVDEDLGSECLQLIE